MLHERGASPSRFAVALVVIASQDPTVPSPTMPAFTRAPAIYLSVGPSSSGHSFRLPIPPAVQECAPGVWAAERRVRNAYFAALDALRTGEVVAERRTKLGRLRSEVRSRDARLALDRLDRVFAAVERQCAAAPGPVLPTPQRAVEVTAIVPIEQFGPAEELSRRFAWAIEWLRTRGYLAGGEAHVRWRAGGAARATPRPPLLADS